MSEEKQIIINPVIWISGLRIDLGNVEAILENPNDRADAIIIQYFSAHQYYFTTSIETAKSFNGPLLTSIYVLPSNFSKLKDFIENLKKHEKVLF